MGLSLEGVADVLTQWIYLKNIYNNCDTTIFIIRAMG
ncbi:MAG: hypothetical protein ACI8S2_001148, partial [Bacteroidia bacterium]